MFDTDPIMNNSWESSYQIAGYSDILVLYLLDRNDVITAFDVHSTKDLPRSLIQSFNHSKHRLFDLRNNRILPWHNLCDNGRAQPRLRCIVAYLIYSIYIAGTRTGRKLHNRVTDALQNFTSRCVVCRRPFGLTLRRATICPSQLCMRNYRSADFEVKLNGSAVFLLLSSVDAVSRTGDSSLLQHFPQHQLSLETFRALVRMLEYIPRSNLSKEVKRAPMNHCPDRDNGEAAELLSSWIGTQFRGWLVGCTTPNSDRHMSGLYVIRQYFLEDAQPEKEASFAVHDNGSRRRILYHGTSMDRLYAVLVDGLRDLSYTRYSQFGAWFGDGVYMARSPNMAVRYAWMKFLSRRSNTPGALLGCEYAGDMVQKRKARHGEYVIKDPYRIMIRYIFFTPPTYVFRDVASLNDQIMWQIRRRKDQRR